MSIKTTVENTIRKTFPDMTEFQISELMKTVNQYSLAAGWAGFAGGAIPGIGTLSFLTSVAFVGAMYIKLTKMVGIKISKVKLKAIASIAIAELSSQAIVYLAGGFILSFIPIISSVATGAAQYAFTYMAGIFYLKLLAGLFGAGKNIEEMTDEEIKARFGACMQGEDIGSMVSGLTQEFKSNRGTAAPIVDMEDADDKTDDESSEE